MVMFLNGFAKYIDILGCVGGEVVEGEVVGAGVVVAVVVVEGSVVGGGVVVVGIADVRTGFVTV